jgi:hypothetical protein
MAESPSAQRAEEGQGQATAAAFSTVFPPTMLQRCSRCSQALLIYNRCPTIQSIPNNKRRTPAAAAAAGSRMIGPSPQPHPPWHRPACSALQSAGRTIERAAGCCAGTGALAAAQQRVRPLPAAALPPLPRQGPLELGHGRRVPEQLAAVKAAAGAAGRAAGRAAAVAAAAAAAVLQPAGHARHVGAGQAADIRLQVHVAHAGVEPPAGEREGEGLLRGSAGGSAGSAAPPAAARGATRGAACGQPNRQPCTITPSPAAPATTLPARPSPSSPGPSSPGPSPRRTRGTRRPHRPNRTNCPIRPNRT